MMIFARRQTDRKAINFSLDGGVSHATNHPLVVPTRGSRESAPFFFCRKNETKETKLVGTVGNTCVSYQALVASFLSLFLLKLANQPTKNKMGMWNESVNHRKQVKMMDHGVEEGRNKLGRNETKRTPYWRCRDGASGRFGETRIHTHTHSHKSKKNQIRQKFGASWLSRQFRHYSIPNSTQTHEASHKLPFCSVPMTAAPSSSS